MMSPLLFSLNPRGIEIIPQIIPIAVVTLKMYNGSFKKPYKETDAINERNPSTKRTDFIGFSFGFSFIFWIIIVSLIILYIYVNILKLFNGYPYVNVNANEELIYKILYIYSRT